MIRQPSNEDLQSIVKAWYPELEPLAGKLIGAVDLCFNYWFQIKDIIHLTKIWLLSLAETFERVNYVPLYQLGGFQSGNHPSFSSLSRFLLREWMPFFLSSSIDLQWLNLLVLNVMDLLKWCKRIAALGFHFLGDGLSSDACKCIFLEVWIFFGFIWRIHSICYY